MLAGQAGSLPLGAGTERCSTQVGSGLTRNHDTRLERLARDKNSSLFDTFVSYEEIMFDQ
jgi:hypothetical protein